MDDPGISGAVDAATAQKLSLRRSIRVARLLHGADADRPALGAAIAAGVLDVWSARDAQQTLVARDVREAHGVPAYGAGVVAIYLSLPTEPPTEQLAAALHDLGIGVIVPELLPDLDLDWRPLRPDGSHGALLGVDAIAAAALVVVPALSIDRSGVRLGQGGGSYDRALARRAPGTVVLAVVNDEEYVAGPLPAEPHDIRVDAVVTARDGVRWLVDEASRRHHEA